MAETAVPRFDKLLWPTLLALREIGGSGTVSETSDKAIEIGGYGEEQQEVLHKGGPSTEIRYRLAWARSYLKAVGALENSVRGVWSITEYGRSLQESDMATIPPQVRSMKRAVDGSAAVETVAVTYEVGPIIS